MPHYVIKVIVPLLLIVIEVLFTARLATDGCVATARLIDRHCRWIFPLIFALCTLAIFLR